MLCNFSFDELRGKFGFGGVRLFLFGQPPKQKTLPFLHSLCQGIFVFISKSPSVYFPT